MAHIEYGPTPAALEFQKVMEATFETLSDKRCNFNTTCKDKTAALWDTYNHDMYQQRAANPKPAVHTSPMLNDGGGRCLNALICNAGEYMAGAKKDALTVPDRSLPHLRHPTWYAGRAVCEMLPKPSLELMGPRHPVKDQIKAHVDKQDKAMQEHGPLTGPKGAKERLEWFAISEAEARAGRGVMPKWMPCCRYNQPINPKLYTPGQYLLEKHRDRATRPNKCNPHMPQCKTLGMPGLLEKDMKLVNQAVKVNTKPGWPTDTTDYMALQATSLNRPKRMQTL